MGVEYLARGHVVLAPPQRQATELAICEPKINVDNFCSDSGHLPVAPHRWWRTIYDSSVSTFCLWVSKIAFSTSCRVVAGLENGGQGEMREFHIQEKSTEKSGCLLFFRENITFGVYFTRLSKNLVR